MTQLLESILASLVGAGGVAVVFAALVKAWFALQLERFKKDQIQQLEAIKADLALVVRLRGSAEEKRAEVAARVLISCLQYMDFLLAVSSPMRIGGDPGVEGFRRDIEGRWRAAQELESEFTKSWVLAETHLLPEVADLMDRMWKRRVDIWASQFTHLDLATQGGRDRSLYEGGFGSSLAPGIGALRNEAKALLRPMAQLASAGSIVALPNHALQPANSSLTLGTRG